MKTIRLPFRLKPFALSLMFSLLPSAFSLVCSAATHLVGANQSIQSVIDGAASGDTIVLTAPIDYPGHLAITGKALHIKGLSDQTTVTGNLSISAVPANGKVTLRNCKVVGNVDANGSSLDLLRCTVEGIVTLPDKQDPTSNDIQLTVLQSNLREKLVSKAARSWIAYSTLEQTYFENKVEIVGNVFDGRSFGGIGIDLNGTATDASIHNNQIYNFSMSANHNISNTCIGIRVDGGAKAVIRNNRISDNRDTNHEYSETWVGIGVWVKSTTGTRIEGNVMWNNYVPYGGTDGQGNCQVYAPAENVVMRNNAFDGEGLVQPRGGVAIGEYIESKDGNWGSFLVDPAGLMNGKPGKNKGPPEVIYNDLDGSRNDIGPNGGRNYIPNGRTTNKPIPISFTASPIAVPVGGVITIESTGATAK
ncbi:MAG: right-handed parallel beta-helix repeat-containing protein [Opitutales bacterium]